MPALKILVVDDNRATSHGLARLLEARGHVAHVAMNGMAALDLLASENPDVVITDLMMPAMDGHAVIRRIRATPGYEQVPIIVISALGSEDVIEQSLAVGANHHLVKPIDFGTLWSILDSAADSTVPAG